MRFKICFDATGGGDFLSRILNDGKELILSVDGKFQSGLEDDQIYWIYDRDEAIQVKDSIYNYVEQKCNSNGYTYPDDAQYIRIEMCLCNKPDHLFSIQELTDVLEMADDRENNTVVVNENGDVLIEKDSRKSFLYPVRNETFGPYCNYVGKYADIKSLVNELYPELLRRWRDYLVRGKSQYIDYYTYTSDDIAQIEEDIRQMM